MPGSRSARSRSKTGGGVGTNQHAVKGASRAAAGSSRPDEASHARLRGQADRLAGETLAFEAPSLAAHEVAIAQREHVLRLADAMAPDPTEWSYDGEVLDGKGNNVHCACGRTIRWVFPIRRSRDGAQLAIGSTCIESSVPYLMAAGADGLAGQLEEAMEAHRQALAETQRRQRDASASEVVQDLAADFESLQSWKREQVAAFRLRRGPRPDLPGSLQQKAALPKAGSTPARTAASMRDRYTKVVLAWAQGDEGTVVAPPVPAEAGLRAKLASALARERDAALDAAERTRSRIARSTMEVEANPEGFTTDQDKVNFRAGVLLDTRESDRQTLAAQQRLAERLDAACRRYGPDPAMVSEPF